MDIFISQNNNETVIQIPVLPAQFNVSLSQNNDTFNSISQGDLKLIGLVGLKTISFSSFFPHDDDNNAPYIKSKERYGHSYVSLLESFMKRRYPVRLIITETGINLPMTIERFDWSVGKSKDIDYTIELSEFRFVNAKGVPAV